MAIPYYYVFNPDIPPAPPLDTYRLEQEQVRFLLCILDSYQDVKFVDELGNEVTLTDDETAIIHAIWDTLMSKNWT